MEIPWMLTLIWVGLLGVAVSGYVLYGIDTPECRTRDAEEKAAGVLAKEFVEEALHVGGTYKLIIRERRVSSDT
jgi:endonuclease YncB( thermonuclease family)